MKHLSKNNKKDLSYSNGEWNKKNNNKFYII